MTQKEIDYASKIRAQLRAMFESSAENHIDKLELVIYENHADFVKGMQRAVKSVLDELKEEVGEDSPCE